MATDQLRVLHLTAADTPAEHLNLLRTVCAIAAATGEHGAIHCGHGPRPAVADVPCDRVHAAGPWSPLRSAVLQRALARIGCGAGTPVIFHAWSAHAARWVLPLTAGHRPLLIQVDPAADLRELAGWATRENVQFVCASLATCARLRACGVPASRVAVIRPALERLTVEPVERARARGRLALRLDDEVILPLPPVARHTGTLFAAWATFLLEKARPRLRLVLPLGGREAARVQRLAAACRHEWMVSHVLADAPLPGLLAAADVAVYLPRRDAPPEALCGARAANCRIVATDVPVVREVLDGAPGVWLCKPDDPADAARKLSAALDSGPPATPDAAQFPRPPTIGEVVLQYRQVYTRLATRRPAALPS